MKKIALLVLFLGLAASNAKAATPVSYTCDRADPKDLVALHFCNEFVFAFSENREHYQLSQYGFRLRISSRKPPYVPDGVTMINVNFTHTTPGDNTDGQPTEVFLDSTMFAVVNRPDTDTTKQKVKDTLTLLDLAIHTWNAWHKPSR
jgi:hypothetical protein